MCTNSSGNHAAALAYITDKFKTNSKIIMPSNSAKIKVNNVKSFNGDIVYCEPTEDKRKEAMLKVKDELGYEIIHPYDDINIILGQATCALEIFQ